MTPTRSTTKNKEVWNEGGEAKSTRSISGTARAAEAPGGPALGLGHLSVMKGKISSPRGETLFLGETHPFGVI